MTRLTKERKHEQTNEQTLNEYVNRHKNKLNKWTTERTRVDTKKQTQNNWANERESKPGHVLPNTYSSPTLKIRGWGRALQAMPHSRPLIDSSERYSVVIADEAEASISKCRAVTCCEGVSEGICERVNEQMIKWTSTQQAFTRSSEQAY